MDFVDIGKKRQKKRYEEKTYKVVEDSGKQKFYILDMFPYPSGAGLHVGHPKGYIATDVIARKHMLQGKKVLHPMGFDTFGLGTEQYAIKNKMKPQVAAATNIETYKKQLEMFGCTYDWDREVNTADPKYFKRTQWTFLKLYNHYFDENTKKADSIDNLEVRIGNGEVKVPKNMSKEEFLDSQRLAYVDYKPINRCPKCKTGLANEDLDSDGTCERCGTMVEQKPMRQWVIRITKYAERLLDGLNQLDGREDSVKDQQRNWIGKSEGTQFKMKVVTPSQTLLLSKEKGPQPIGKKMDSGYHMIELARKLRKRMTNSESFLWELLRGKQLNGFKFRRQHPLGNYIADFYCPELKLVIELDGSIHNIEEQKDIDKERDLIMKQYGLTVKRFKNQDVLDDIESVLKEIIDFSEQTSLSLERRGIEGEVEYSFEVYTTRIDTVFGMSFVVMAPEHKLVDKITTDENKKVVEEYQEAAKHKTQLERTELQKDKSGVFTGAYAINPFNDQKIPIYVGDYVLANYGTGVVMAVPAHDERDFEFAKKYGIEIKSVVSPHPTSPSRRGEDEIISLSSKEREVKSEVVCYTEKGILVDSGDFTGLSSDEAIEKMQEWLQKEGIGGKKINYRLQDRVFSRQRYRGEPIPMIYCEKCGIVPMKEEEMPLELPEVENYKPTGSEEGPLANIDERINVKCPKCGGNAKRESNTMPGWAGSSWYWIRYMDPNNENELVSPQKENFRDPVDVYVGGAEHITRHMIYARFWHNFLQDLGIVSVDEPFKKYQHVGLIMAEDGRKMSKRRGNVINPDDIINEFGSDTLRVYEMFMGPFDQAVAWNTNGVKGVKKFLDKIVNLYSKVDDNVNDDKKTLNVLHNTIKKVSEDIDRFGFNTAIAQMMILVNELSAVEKISEDTFEKLILILAPFAPHLAEELWERMGNDFSVFNQNVWPNYDEKYLVQDKVKMAIQFNGKVRGTIEVAPDADQDQVMELVKQDKKMLKYLEGDIVKIIYIPGKICNIVIR